MKLKATSDDLYLNRRAFFRVEFRQSIRFAPDPTRPLRLSQGVSQNVSLKGMELLSSVVLDREKSFPIWIPIGESDVITAQAKTIWMTIEDSYGDSPYWIRSGVVLSVPNSSEKSMLLETISHKSNPDRIHVEQEKSKVGFVF